MRQLFIYTLLLMVTSLFGQSEKKASKAFEEGDFKVAVNSYIRLADGDPSNGSYATRIGDCYLAMNRLSEAKTWYEQALGTQDAGPVLRLKLGHVLKSLGNYEEAKREYEKYAIVDPNIGFHFAESCDFAKTMLAAPSPYLIKPEYINTVSDEITPVFFGDLVIMGVMPPKGLDLPDDARYSNLMVSSVAQNGYLKIPIPLSDELTQCVKIGPLDYSESTNEVFFTKNNFKYQVRPVPLEGTKMSLHIAKLNGDGTWFDERAFSFNGSGYSSGYPSISTDAKTLYFASDRPDGYGGWDIYVSRKIGSTWTRPENLGPMVNTPGNEIAPMYDGEHLYFASNHHPGLGGYDIFKAAKQSEIWNRIYHLGNQVNSPKDDLGLVFNESHKMGYLASNRSGGKGGMDIYRVQRHTDQLAISVKDQLGTPISNAIIDLSACDEASFRTDKSGSFTLQVLGGFSCEAVIRKSGYASQEIRLAASGNNEVVPINVVLSAEAKKFFGTVVMAQGNKPVPNVLVKATDQKSGKEIETYTDGAGSYGLGLTANTTYIIRYSKVGYSDTHKKIKTDGEMSDDMLGVLPFEEVYALPMASNNSANQQNSSLGNSAPPSTGDFSIQLAATSNASAINLDEFSALRNEGSLYFIEEKGLTKVRLGNFESRAAAQAALTEVKRKGYTESFIIAAQSAPVVAQVKTEVKEVKVEQPQVIAKEVKPKSEPVVSQNTSVIPTPKPTPAASPRPVLDGDNSYKIRLATYKNTKYFDPSKIEQYGVIEKVIRGEYTIMVLSKFATENEARSLLPSIKAAGFKTAHVLKVVDGKWNRLK